jgi:hypothetical protein
MTIIVIIGGYLLSVLLARLSRKVYRSTSLMSWATRSGATDSNGGRYGLFCYSVLHKILRNSVKNAPIWITTIPVLNLLYVIWAIIYPVVHLLLFGVGKLRYLTS